MHGDTVFTDSERTAATEIKYNAIRQLLTLFPLYLMLLRLCIHHSSM